MVNETWLGLSVMDSPFYLLFRININYKKSYAKICILNFCSYLCFIKITK